MANYIEEQFLSEEQLKILQQYKDKKRLTPADFSLKVEQYVHQNNETYMDSILFLSALYEMDFEKSASMLTDNVKIKLAKETHLLEAVYNVDSDLESCFAE